MHSDTRRPRIRCCETRGQLFGSIAHVSMYPSGPGYVLDPQSTCGIGRSRNRGAAPVVAEIDSRGTIEFRQRNTPPVRIQRLPQHPTSRNPTNASGWKPPEHYEKGAQATEAHAQAFLHHTVATSHSRGPPFPAVFHPLPYFPRTGDTLPRRSRTSNCPEYPAPIPHPITSSIRLLRPAVPSAASPPLGTQINFPTDPAESLHVRHFPPRQERFAIHPLRSSKRTFD